VNRVLRLLADGVKKPAIEFGFKARGSPLLREDGLASGIQLDMLNSRPETASFVLLFDLGMPGLGTFTARNREWVVPRDRRVGVM
jgi:hypothetical protein